MLRELEGFFDLFDNMLIIVLFFVDGVISALVCIDRYIERHKAVSDLDESMIGLIISGSLL